MNVKLDVPYPEVMVESENIKYANILSQAYAGITSEVTASLLYSYQHFITDNNDFKKIIEEISIVEMKHVELLGETIKLLGSDPKYKTCNSINDECVMWTSDNIKYETDYEKILLLDITSETKAIDMYKKYKKLIDDKYIKKLLDRILLDEYNHLDIFNKLYKDLKKS